MFEPGTTRVRPGVLPASRAGIAAVVAMVLVGLAVPTSEAVAQTPSPDRVAGDAHLRPGDVIKLRIWREDDLSGEYMVHDDGTAVFPKIGVWQVDTESPSTLRDKLIEAYQRYLVNPAIEVTMLRRVNVLGAVRDPGLYPIDPTMTIADALALAGGALQTGKPNEVELIRGGQRITANISQRTRLDELPLRSGDQLFVPERHWMARHTAIVATVISATVTLIIALAL